MAKLRSATSNGFDNNSSPPKNYQNSLIVAKFEPHSDPHPQIKHQDSSRQQSTRARGDPDLPAQKTGWSILTMINYLIIFSLTTAAAVHVIGFSLNPMDAYQYGYCKLRECCHPNDGTGYIRYRNGSEVLLQELQNKVYGQPLIVKPLYKSIKAHLHNENPIRPLSMYFSGWTGTGKTHVARLVASSLYKEGLKSKFVKYISSSYHFPVKIETDHDIAFYRAKLRDMIRDVVKNCERSLIILDELDKLPAGVVDALQPMLDYVDDLDGVGYNKAIFIFLSNTGAERLNLLSYKMFREGKERKDLSIKDVEEILIQESFVEQGGLKDSSLLKRYSIGVFVPFLPLERSHVRQCIRDEIESQFVIPDNQEQLIDEIADEMTFFPEETQLYSKSGCKGVHDKVVNHIGPPIHFSSPKSDNKFLRKNSEL